MKHKHIKIAAYLLVVLIANSALATVHYVPEEHTTIQAAINVCADSDTVIVAPAS